MGFSPGLDAYRLSFEISPIILTGGIALNLPGGMLPIISITESLNFAEGLLSGSVGLDYGDFFAHFYPLTGSKLISQKAGEYPLANQLTAANAIIRDPLVISMMMLCPAKGEAGYATKTATMLALQFALAQHNNSGGTYTVMTPAFFYFNCIMLDVTDAAVGGRQPQSAYQIDFRQPLITLQSAQAAQGSIMSQITAGLPINGDPSWSGLSQAVGNPATLGAVGIIPAAQNPAGTGSSSPFGSSAGPQLP